MSSTFGQTSVLGTPLGLGLNQCLVAKATLTETGVVSKITAYMANQAGSHANCYVRGVCYTDNSGRAQTRVFSTDPTQVLDNAAAAWVDFVLATPQELSAGDYWIGMHVDADGEGLTVNYAETGGSGADSMTNNLYADGDADTFSSATYVATRDISTYATYELPSTGFTGLTVTRLLNG